MQSRFSKPFPDAAGAAAPDPLPEAQSRAVDELVRQFRETNRRSEAAQDSEWRERQGRITDPSVLRGARGER